MPDDEQDHTEAAQVALSFARALVDGQYDAARDLLDATLRAELQASDLRAEYELMTSYWPLPATRVEVAQVDLTPDPTREDGSDVGWVYVPIESHPPDDVACLEAVCVRVVRDSGRLRIAQVVWGRP
jgi:hypothetical protein